MKTSYANGPDHFYTLPSRRQVRLPIPWAVHRDFLPANAGVGCWITLHGTITTPFKWPLETSAARNHVYSKWSKHTVTIIESYLCILPSKTHSLTQIPNEDYSTERLTRSLQACQSRKSKKSIRNCHGQEEPKETQLNIIWHPWGNSGASKSGNFWGNANEVPHLLDTDVSLLSNLRNKHIYYWNVNSRP